MSKAKTLEIIEHKTANAQTRRSHRRAYRIGTAVAVLLFFGTVLYLTLGDPLQDSGGQVVTPENVEDFLKQMDESGNSANPSFETVMNYSWLFPTGDAVSSNAYVENSINNQNDFYFIVTLMDTSQTILYVSPNLKPGEALDSIKLDAGLAAGNYRAQLTYHLLDKSGNVEDTVQMMLEIVVEG